jgi:hypothetical protein
MNPEIRILQERLDQLEERCRTLEADAHQSRADCRQSRADCRALRRRLRTVCGLGVASLMVALFASPTSRAVAQSGYGATIQSLINKTQFIAVEGGEMYVRNTNLHIENGLGATNGNPGDPLFGAPMVNGTGNLILGYNASRVPLGGPDLRTGSHNLILGDFQNYTSYGGLVAGLFNAITAPYASVSGGDGNTASGPFSSVSGGDGNTASGVLSSVSGGRFNTASNFYASVSGGDGNTASGSSSSVSGGLNHNQGGTDIWQGGTLTSGP